MYMAAAEGPWVEEEPVQKPRVRGPAGGREGCCENPPGTRAEWGPLRGLGGGSSRLPWAAVLRTGCRGRGWQEEAVALHQGSRRHDSQPQPGNVF